MPLDSLRSTLSMHHSKKSNIATFTPDSLNKLVVRCIDKVERNESKGINLTSST